MISRNSAGAREGGFTLLEMTIVLVVLALAAGLALSRGPMRNEALEIRATGAQIVEFLRLARSQAIARDRPRGVAFDLARRVWRDSGGTLHRLPANLVLTVNGTPGARGEASIVFYPDGSAAGGAIDLAEGSHRLAIEVDWLTGRVGFGPG